LEFFVGSFYRRRIILRERQANAESTSFPLDTEHMLVASIINHDNLRRLCVVIKGSRNILSHFLCLLFWRNNLELSMAT
jgi:hypothetical protein